MAQLRSQGPTKFHLRTGGCVGIPGLGKAHSFFGLVGNSADGSPLRMPDIKSLLSAGAASVTNAKVDKK